MNQHINLLSKREDFSSRVILVWTLFTVFLFGLMAILGYQKIEQSSLAQEVERSQQLIITTEQSLKDKRRAAGFKDPDALTREIAATRSKIETNQGLLAQIETGELGLRNGHTELLRLLSSQSEKGVWLTSVDVTKSGNSVSLSGRALSSQAVMRYSRKLNVAMKAREPEFKFTEIEITKTGASNSAPNLSPASPGTSASVGAGSIVNEAVRFTLK